MKKNTGFGSFRHYAAAGFLLIGSMVMLCGCAVSQTQFISASIVSETEDDEADSSATDAAGSLTDTAGESQTAPPSGIYVYVCGAVNHPGVYQLREEARVYEAVDAAGGFTEDASEVSVNQARLLTDGEELYVPGKEDADSQTIPAAAAAARSGGAQTGTQDGKININTADAAALTTLTGIGETKAASIIAWREENGSFSSIEDIKKVDGIADKTYEKIKDEITVN